MKQGRKTKENTNRKYHFNQIDQAYTDKVILVTWWVIVAICYLLSFEVLIGGKILTFIPLFLFSILIMPNIKDKIKLNKYVLILLRVVLLGLTFYSVQF